MKKFAEILKESFESDTKIKKLVSNSPLKGDILQNFLKSVKNLDQAGLSRVIKKINPPGSNMTKSKEDDWRLKYLLTLRKSLRYQ